MGSTGTRTAVVYDPKGLWHDALEEVLTPEGGAVVGRVTDGDEAAGLTRALRPDVFVAAADPPDPAAALECVRRVRAASPSTKTIVVSQKRERGRIEAAFEAGADVYYVSTVPTTDLATAIRQAFDRSIFHAAQLAPRPPRDSNEDGGTAAPRLTRREREILRLVAEGHSNSQLAQMLCVTEQTVKFHLSNVYRKLGVSNRTEASRWAQLHNLLPRRAAQTTTS